MKLNLDKSSDLHPGMEKDFPFIYRAAQRCALCLCGVLVGEMGQRRSGGTNTQPHKVPENAHAVPTGGSPTTPAPAFVAGVHALLGGFTERNTFLLLENTYDGNTTPPNIFMVIQQYYFYGETVRYSRAMISYRTSRSTSSNLLM